MTEKTDKKREAPISYRPPALLRDEFFRRVEASGLSANSYITKALFGAAAPRATRTPRVEKEMLATLLARSAAIRDALDDAAHRAGDDASAIEAIRDACADIMVIRTAVMKLLERER